jgi:hypothetical protein
MAMPLGFNQRLEKGKRTEAIVAHYASKFGWTVDAIGSIGDQKAPSLITTNEAGEFEYTRSPDLVMEKWPLQPIAIEVKEKKTYNGSILLDEERMEYIRKWSQLKRQLVIWVIQRTDHDNELVCASTEKLWASYHTYNPESTKYKSTELQPTFLFFPDVFIPFRRVLETQLNHIQMTQNMYLPNEKGEMQLI